jgi:hypothetical protein
MTQTPTGTSALSPPEFGTPERPKASDNAERVRSKGVSPLAGPSGVVHERHVAVQAVENETAGSRYDPDDAERSCKEAARVVLGARSEIAARRARLAEYKASHASMRTPTKKMRKKASAKQDTPGTVAHEREAKGLKSLSMRVCEKVEEKKHTTYNEVADELVVELKVGVQEGDGAEFDEKNIRRRVYDALNVLTALEIIAKKKKQIFWNGFPEGYVKPAAMDAEQPPTPITPKAEHDAADDDIDNDNDNAEFCPVKEEAELEEYEKSVRYLAELVEQHDALVALINRNKKVIDSGAPPATGIPLPFILISTKADATIEVEISEDQRNVHFDFNTTPFQIHDGFHVLTHMLKLHKKRIPDENVAHQDVPSTSKGVGKISEDKSKSERATPAKRSAPSKSPIKSPTQQNKKSKTTPTKSPPAKRAKKT